MLLTTEESLQPATLEAGFHSVALINLELMANFLSCLFECWDYSMNHLVQFWPPYLIKQKQRMYSLSPQESSVTRTLPAQTWWDESPSASVFLPRLHTYTSVTSLYTINKKKIVKKKIKTTCYFILWLSVGEIQSLLPTTLLTHWRCRKEEHSCAW